MKKINWKPKRPSKNNNPYITARIGNMVLHCYLEPRCRWSANVSIREMSGTFRYGPCRQSLAKVKEDAVRLSRELLLDYQAGLDVELKNFDL